MKREREEVEKDTSITAVEEEKGSPEKKAKPSVVENSCSDIACFGAGCYWFFLLPTLLKTISLIH